MADINAVYGNYHGYYANRMSSRDSRLALLPGGIFEGKRVLDIGCNEGWVTCEIAQTLGAKAVIGVDIDDSLVRAAWRRRRSVWSTQRIGPDDSSLSNGRSAKRRRRDDEDEIVDYPAAFEHMFGPLPIPPADTSGSSSSQFPHNVIFRTTDWLKDGAVEDEDGYDIILALSITKWIHLNNGDDGIVRFFKRVHSVLRPEGAFVLEPQEWETYSKARRMATHLKENYKALNVRPSEFESILRDIGFTEPVNCGSTGKGGIPRDIYLYRKLTNKR